MYHNDNMTYTTLHLDLVPIRLFIGKF